MSRLRSPLNRRTVLRGAGSIALGLPFLDAMSPTVARAAAKPPRRFMTFFESNGYIRDSWKPTGPESGFQFSKILEPLEPYRDHLVVVDGLNIKKKGRGTDHMKGMGGVFTGCELQTGSFEAGAGFANGHSIDQYVASKIGAATSLRSIELGVKCDARSTPETRCSFDLNKTPVPPLNAPQAAFDRLFKDFKAAAGVKPPAGGPAIAPNPALLQRKAVLDLVLDDYRRLRGTLGSGDRQRLEAHLTTVEDIDRRLQQSLTGAAPSAGGVPVTANAACRTPTGSFAGSGSCAGQDDCSDGDMAAVGRLHMDLIAMAFACDRVRVASLQWSNAGNRIVYRTLGMSQTHHDLAHAAAKAALVQLNTWYASHAAYLLGKLAAIHDGDGTSVLHNSLILFGNELSNGAVHGHGAMPFLLAGRAGGALRAGRFLSYDGTAHNALLVSCLNLMGINENTFGSLAPGTGPLPGL